MDVQTLPKTMRAAEIDRFGAPEVVHLAVVDRPDPGPDEVLVRMRAASLTVADHRMRARDLPAGWGLVGPLMLGIRRPRTRRLGVDGAGVVVATGAGVTAWAPGDEVLVASGLAMGFHAEYVVVRADRGIARKPAGTTFEEAAALPFGAVTALVFLARAQVGPGTRVLVNGASGAVGTAVVQLAHAAGAHVTGVCSGRNADLVRSLGADRVVDYTTTDFAREGEVYDVVVDCVGNAPVSRVAPVVRRGGAVLAVVGTPASMVLAPLHGLRVRGTVAVRGATIPLAEQLRQVTAAVEAGTLRPVVDRVFDFDDVVEAHRYVDTGRKRGNVVLRLA
ncbi:NAD(P)-dependent alcohol dehydrogenase [Cellulomonas fimi]|uniref:Alcohol dehydrogenase zinc-binding domain protein n=1 Tax=Cellulomonas fimi (strain ATCC 484 / DSM 20113 / JCM 1341 / CCUG 24087 / LMG 16345 / NBRC 15513 / NCIMB 8980 / NCTC 7547 / NRS-133) TaxID=590998 RepID=F4GZI4_CELFA|nr:NAD(P)-dependent alcohol dehydrogenase [Cellulomonas fimi]AEE44905.1 Alcohol dehydrogenase zinc-binding domain protein [Cellulomonas fimi ATCC 484]NNH08277.1 NAD(P)-dependent alcohol dehydrogenase [Cellulomonas fimi]VEH27637.1 Quinone oxidoreductase 1 [Cellulomonas fimi]